tara:strand:+ start:579 stop:932 length:354 start_codon:yes stop_codon:yes gene_type:complete
MTGRPAWIPTNSICEQAREIASRGLTVSQIADCLGISESTLYGKQNEYKEFMDAIKKGRAEALNSVSNALFEKATQGNVTAMIYYLKVRDRTNWGENQPEPLKEIPPMQIILTGVST